MRCGLAKGTLNLAPGRATREAIIARLNAPAGVRRVAPVDAGFPGLLLLCAIFGPGPAYRPK